MINSLYSGHFKVSFSVYATVNHKSASRKLSWVNAEVRLSYFLQKGLKGYYLRGGLSEDKMISFPFVG